jgi:hypothetical protein
MKENMERPTCQEEGCGRRARNKGLYKGKRRYGRFCEQHHKGVSTRWRFDQEEQIDNTSCSRCGWDRAPCDRHRVDPTKGYVRENVKVLCPNCHRLEHLGL